MALIQVDQQKCEKEGICVEVCPVGILSLDDDREPRVVGGMGQFCVACGHCVAVCPHGALDNVRNPLALQGVQEALPVVDAKTALAFLRSRRSIRCYKEDPVPRDLALQLLDAARYAPSGHNTQGLSYLLVEQREHLKRMSALVVEWMTEVVVAQPELANRLHMPGIIKSHERGEDRILRNAPLVIVALADKKLPAAQVTTYLALEYVELYATTLGLGTCWAGYAQICAQQYSRLSEFLKIPSTHVITGIMMAGFPRYHYHRLPARDPLQVSWLGE